VILLPKWHNPSIPEGQGTPPEQATVEMRGSTPAAAAVPPLRQRAAAAAVADADYDANASSPPSPHAYQDLLPEKFPKIVHH